VSSFILQSVKRSENHPIPATETRIGFTVTKKMGGAVARNRIKRRLREAARPVIAKLGKSGHDYVVIARQKALTCDFSELMRDMEFAFNKIIYHKSSGLKTTPKSAKKTE
jgi:ribonuclease P protein component